MADVTLSPNMTMPVPNVGTDPGPDWANNLNACLSVVDGHNHSPGKGVPVTPDGLSISSDLSFQGNNATLLRTVRLQSQAATLSAAADIGCLYEVGVDLYYNDGSGNQIRITQSGAVAGAAGTITGLPSGTASASFSAVTGTFTFQQATSTGASMDTGALIVRYSGSYPTPSGNYTAIQANSSLSTGYAFTLPAAAAGVSGAMLTSDATGNLSYTVADNSTLAITAGTLAVPTKGITATQLGSGAAAAGATATADGSGGVIYAFHSYIGTLIGSGSGNFTVPTGVSFLFVEMAGGGGGGGGGISNSGGGGGSGALAVSRTLAVTAGQVIAYSVGAAGTAGGAGVAGGNGGTTTFGTLTAKGGKGGSGGSGGTGGSGGAYVAGNGGAGGSGANTGGNGSAGAESVYASGGSGGSASSGIAGGGGGGAGMGNGGNGGVYNVSSPTAGAANSGAGGGGGAAGQSGAAGAAGYLNIYYMYV